MDPHILASPAHITAGTSILKTTIWVTCLIAGALIGGGIVLVSLGATGNTELTLFGNTFKSTTVGAVGIFCGAVLGIIGIRRTLLALERLGNM